MLRLMVLMLIIATCYGHVTNFPTTTQQEREHGSHVHKCGDNGKENDAIPEEIVSCRDAKKDEPCSIDGRKGFCYPVGNCDNDKCQLRCIIVR